MPPRRKPRRRNQRKNNNQRNANRQLELQPCRREFIKSSLPPQLPVRPGFTRWVRIRYTTTPGTVYYVQANSVFLQDAIDYSVVGGASRWNTARFLKARAYPPVTEAASLALQNGEYAVFVYALVPGFVSSAGSVQQNSIFEITSDVTPNTIGSRPRPLAWTWGQLDASSEIRYTSTVQLFGYQHSGANPAITTEDWIFDFLVHFVN